jgi:hypothetical protein
MPSETPAVKERVLAFWFPALPARRLALLRVFCGAFALVYLLVRASNLLSVTDFEAERFQPVGALALLTQPLPAWLLQSSLGLGIAFGVAFTLGFRFAVSGPAFACLLLGLTTYRNCWGMIFHTENLLTLHVMLLAASPASDAFSLDARRRPPNDEPDGRFGWAVRAMSLVTVVAYVVAGVAKLKLSGGSWLGGELLRAQIAYDNLRKLELGTRVSPLGPWLVQRPGVFPFLAIATLFVELGAPLALRGRRWAAAWVAAAWGFHVGVLLLMSISFVYQLSGVAYLSFFPVERLLERWAARRSALETRVDDQNSSVSPSGNATSALGNGSSRSSKPAAHS